MLKGKHSKRNTSKLDTLFVIIPSSLLVVAVSACLVGFNNSDKVEDVSEVMNQAIADSIGYSSEVQDTMNKAIRDAANKAIEQKVAIDEAKKKAEEEAAQAAAEQAAAEQAASQTYYEDYSYSEPSYSSWDGPTSSYSGGSVSGSSFRSAGVIYDDNGTRYTWYSENVLPGGGLTDLNNNGRHVDEQGFIRDGDGYLAAASNDYAQGTIVDTPFGQAKIYDSGCASGTVDMYVSW